MQDAVTPLVVLLNCCKGKQTDKYYVDSRKLEVCHNLQIRRHKVFKDIAQRGKTSTGWFFGFKLHLVLNDQEEIMSFTITPGNTDNRVVVEKITQHLTGLLFEDRGYISKKLTKTLRQQRIELITRLKKNMKSKPLSALNNCFAERGLIETAIGQLKEICQIQHTRHRYLITSWQTSSQGFWLMSSNQTNLPSPGKIDSQRASLRQAEVFLRKDKKVCV